MKNEPAKIVLELRPKPGQQEKLEEWIPRLIRTAANTGLEGSSVLTSPQGEYFILLRFAGQGKLDQWQKSPQVRALLDESATYAEAAHQPVVKTGLETWFTLPGHPASGSPPPKWKMALVTWIALLPQVILLSYLIPKSLPPLLAVAISTAIPVIMLTWVIMPRLTRLLYRWLYPLKATTA